MKKCPGCGKLYTGGACAACAKGPTVATARPVRRRPRMIPRRAKSSSAAKVTIGGAIAVVITLLLIGMRVANTTNRIMGKSIVDETVSIPADDVHDGGVEVQGSVSYTFTVTSHDGEVLMVFGPIRDFNNPTDADFARLMSGARKVGRGMTEVMSGGISTGHYAWAVINPGKAPVRVYVKFHGR